MLRQPIRSLGFALLMVVLGTTSVGAAASKADRETKFQSDLESLLGAVVKTNYGELAIRQRKDDAGHVRKQIIVGKDFQEIQIDHDGDGTVDYWLVRKGTKTVEASQPQMGRFLRLEIQDQVPTGLRHVTYVLNPDGRSYSLVKNKFTGKNIRAQSESASGALSSFEPADQPTPAILSTASAPSLSDLANRQERIALQEQTWVESQKAVFGSENLCEGVDPVSESIARVQRDWWKILTRDVNNKKADLAKMLKDSSTMFNSSCRKAANKKDLDRIADALATVMMSSSKGEPKSKDGSRGSYLTCLDNSGLGVLGAKMEANFLSGLTERSRSSSLFTCEFVAGDAGGSLPAEAESSYVIIHMTAAVEGTQKTATGSTQNFENTLFHEMMHVAGVPRENEKLAHAAQACCGDPTVNKIYACDILDSLVAEEKRLSEIVTNLSRVDNGVLGFNQTLENSFGGIAADELSRAFFLGMDDADPSLLSSAEFTVCVSKSGEAACRQQWADKASKYFDDFFPSRCKKLVASEFKGQCKKMASSVKSQLASTVANSFKTFGACDKKSVAGTQPASLWNQAWMQIAQNIFGAEAGAEDEVNCGSTNAIPNRVTPVPNVATANGGVSAPQDSGASNADGTIRMRSITPPNTPTTSEVVGNSGREDAAVGQAQQSRPTAPARSPLPVTRVESSSGGRSFAEERYRRATDFAGVATKGFERARDLILPAAVAANEQSKVGSRSRLSPDASFVAFKPTKGDQLAIKLDNPFSSSRTVASIADVQIRPGSSSRSGVVPSASGAGAVSGTNAGRAEGSSALNAPAGNPAKGKRAGATVGALGAGTAKLASSTGSDKAPTFSGSDTKRKGDAGLLEGLFTHPYREIEPRLNQLAVVEALISGKYRIVDAQKRKVGSSHALHCYDYVGMDKPLRKLATCAAGRE